MATKITPITKKKLISNHQTVSSSKNWQHQFLDLTLRYIMIPWQNSKKRLILRHASINDLAQLEELEFDCFDDEAFSRRRWRYLLQQAQALTLVIEDPRAILVNNQRILAYINVLTRRNSDKARVYSIAVHPKVRGLKLAYLLLTQMQQELLNGQYRTLLLECRVNNRRALRLYRYFGFIPFQWLEDYYSDHCAAWRMMKSLTDS